MEPERVRGSGVPGTPEVLAAAQAPVRTLDKSPYRADGRQGGDMRESARCGGVPPKSGNARCAGGHSWGPSGSLIFAPCRGASKPNRSTCALRSRSSSATSPAEGSSAQPGSRVSSLGTPGTVAPTSPVTLVYSPSRILYRCRVWTGKWARVIVLGASRLGPGLRDSFSDVPQHSPVPGPPQRVSDLGRGRLEYVKWCELLSVPAQRPEDSCSNVPSPVPR